MASSTTLNLNGQLYLSSGAKAFDTVAYVGGSAHAYRGGALYDTTVNSGGFAFVREYATASSLDVNSRGRLYVYDYGATSDVVINSGGYLHLYGGKATGVYNSGGYIFGYFNGIETSVISSAYLYNAGKMYVSRGSVASDTYIGSGCIAAVYNNASMTNTQVDWNGELQIKAGAVADGIDVTGGKVSLTGGSLTGKMNTNGGRIIAASGNINFAVNEHTAAEMPAFSTFAVVRPEIEGETLIDDFSAFQISSPVKFSLTVAAGVQETGIYKLAAGASAFNYDLTIRNSAGTEYGLIEDAEGYVEYGNRGFEVWRDGDELLLEVWEIDAADSLWSLAAGDFNGDGVLTDIYMDADSNLYEGESTDSNNRIGLLAEDWEIAGVADYNKDGTDDLMLKSADGSSVEYWSAASGNRWKTVATSKKSEGILA